MSVTEKIHLPAHCPACDHYFMQDMQPAYARALASCIEAALRHMPTIILPVQPRGHDGC